MATQRLKDGLTPQQHEFCYAYLAHKSNGTEAAIEAGYSKKTAYVQASKLLNHPKIKERIAELTEKALNKLTYTAQDVLNELAIMGFSNINNYMTFKDDTACMKSNEEIGEASRAIQSIEIIPQGENGNKIKFKLHDKKGSLDLLGKNLQLFTDKIDLTSGGKPLEGPTIYLPDNGRNRD